MSLIVHPGAADYLPYVMRPLAGWLTTNPLRRGLFFGYLVASGPGFLPAELENLPCPKCEAGKTCVKSIMGNAHGLFRVIHDVANELN